MPPLSRRPQGRAESEGRSPWVDRLPPRPPAAPLDADAEADVVVVGAGIAGVATAHFLLRDTDRRVLLLERDRVARGATGFNAGQLVSYFERPLCQLAAEYGAARAVAAQRDVLGAWGLLERMVGEARVREPVHRFTGHLGLHTLDDLTVHLEDNLLRRRGGLPRERCWVSEKAEFLSEIPDRYAGLYEVVPQYAVQERLETEDPRYTALISEPKGCTNSALLCEQVVESLRAAHPERFRLAERTPVGRIVLRHDHALLEAGGHRIRAARVVLCSNGFADHVIENRSGAPIAPAASRVRGTVGFMAAFLEAPRRPSATSYVVSPRIGGGPTYFYVTRSPFRVDGRTLTLTCVGGPDAVLADPRSYDPKQPYPREVLARIDGFVRSTLAREPGVPARYEYVWHGLMAYTEGQVRVVGAEPRNPVLLYNLGCNGVGLLPSIHGGHRIARLLSGERLPPSLFDPR